MRVACTIGFAFALLSAGCSGIKSASSAAQPGAAESAAPAPSQASAPGPPTPMIAKPVVPLVPEVVNPPAAPGDVNAAPPAKPVAPRSRAAPKTESSAPVAAKQASSTLDLTSLEQRLKDTRAIGVLTKIELKNQVDDLLDQFRAFYQGKLKTTLAELRRPYDRLVMKVLTLLQDSDPSLAAAIVASREAIWGILADPVKFATI